MNCQNSDSPLTVHSWPNSRYGGPRVIGHRGASHHVSENSLTAFSLATTLGADMWELDARVSADGVCVISHDDSLQSVFKQKALISQTNYSELRALTGNRLASLQEVIELATSLGSGLYIELKDSRAGDIAYQLLRDNEFDYAALGAFNVEWIKALTKQNCSYPTAVLVPVGKDPFAMAQEAKASIIHLCWENACDSPQHLVSNTMLATASELGLQVVLWHEERPKVIKALLELPVAGICSNRPEFFVPYPGSASRNSVSNLRTQVVCHRGAEFIAPENTMAAFTRAFEQGFDWVEIDIQQTLDGKLVVLHDESLQRTIKGSGNIAEKTWQQVSQLDAGSHFDPIYDDQRIPLLSDVIDLAKSYNKSLYIELKNCCAHSVLQQVQQQHFLADCFFWSFSTQKLNQIRTLDATANIMSRAQDFDSIALAVSALDACVIEIESSAKNIEQQVLDTRALGCKVMLCYQGDDIEIFKKIINLKPDLLNLKRADLWKQALFEYPN